MNGISSRNVVDRNYFICSTQERKQKQWQVIITNVLSLPAHPPGRDGNNETCLKMITHSDDKKTLKPHLTSDFIGPLHSPFTRWQKNLEDSPKGKVTVVFLKWQTWAEWFDIHQPVKWNWRKLVIRRSLLQHTKISCGSSLGWGAEGESKALEKAFLPKNCFVSDWGTLPGVAAPLLCLKSHRRAPARDIQIPSGIAPVPTQQWKNPCGDT